MVVQCPTCQSKFRIADDKVTDRGVRVRCTSCKAVFQVKKPGASASDPAPGPGNTMDLSSLNAAAVARPGARPAATTPRAAASPASRPPPAPSVPPRPAAASRPPAAARNGPNGTARRLQANDLFGMAELTGDAPLGDISPAPSKPPPAPPAAKPASKAAAKPMPNFDDIDIDVDDAPPSPPLPSKPRPPPPPRAAEAAPSAESSSVQVSLDAEPSSRPPPPPSDHEEPGEESVTLGAFKSGPLKDPFEGMNLGEHGTGAIELAAQPKKDKLGDAAATEPTGPIPPAVPEIPLGRELVSSALTGLVGAALAVAVVVVAALSGEPSAGWLGFGAAEDVVATRVVSGLYDTASGKPVFYIRGRIENRGKKVRGPVRVTAELVSNGAAEAHAEAIAGLEPTAEEVWSLRSSSDVEKLTHTLQLTQTERKLSPGGSLPFFAVISDPPADLQRHRLHVRVESVDAWVPPSPRKGR